MDNILLFKDIENSVVKKTGCTKEDVREVYGSLTDNLQHLIDNTNEPNIGIPELGTIYFPLYYFRKLNKKMEHKRDFHKRISQQENTTYEWMKEKKVLIDQYIEKHNKGNKRKGGVRNQKLPMLISNYHSCAKTIKEIEDLQNNL